MISKFCQRDKKRSHYYFVIDILFSGWCRISLATTVIRHLKRYEILVNWDNVSTSNRLRDSTTYLQLFNSRNWRKWRHLSARWHSTLKSKFGNLGLNSEGGVWKSRDLRSYTEKILNEDVLKVLHWQLTQVNCQFNCQLFTSWHVKLWRRTCAGGDHWRRVRGCERITSAKRRTTYCWDM